MKVLFVLCKDVHNITSFPIAKEMLERGYDVDFYGMFLDDIHIRMFKEKNISVFSIDEFNIDSINKYDYIYSAISIENFPLPINLNKYIFSFSTMFMDESSGYGDYTFTQRDMNIKFQENKYLIEEVNPFKVSPGMVVGNPKYSNRKEKSEIKKQFLFIDAGHFPFGKTGKIEEAKMLLEIAEKYPDYKLLIKPRFLRNDKNVTHKNDVHLYDCLEKLSNNNIPSNIYCLEEHKDLGELIKESSTIITVDGTTSYLEIAAYGKRGIVAAGLPSEEAMTYSAIRKKYFTKIVERSGLCIPYKKVIEYLPQGLECREEHKNEMGIMFTNTAKNIVNSMENIFEKYIKFEIYPAPNIMHGKEKKYVHFNEVINLRYIKKLYGIVGEVQRLIIELDFSQIKKYVDSLFLSSEIMSQDTFNQYLKKVERMMGDLILRNKEKMLKDARKQSYYLQTLYDCGKLQFEKETDYEAKEIFWCLMGKYEIIENKNPRKALEYFNKWESGIVENTYEKTLADMRYYIESATYWIGYCYWLQEEYVKAKKYFEKCQILTDNKHNKAKEFLEKIAKFKLS